MYPMQFTMMKIFNFVSLYGIVILWLNRYANAIPYGVKLTITRNDEPTTVQLKPLESFLANENLPIWMVRDGKLFKTDSEEVMEQLGPFTMYQDPDSSSAAVYFHKRRAFDGTIDARYIIKGLIPDDDDDNNGDENKENNNFQFKFPIFERKSWGHTYTTCVPEPRWMATTFESEWIKNLPSSPRRQPSQTFYIETLVVINHKMAVELLNEYSDSSAIISYVLTLFNTVDMLFTKIRLVNVRINIAGIIIENERGSIPHMAKCYRLVKRDEIYEDGLDTTCTINNLHFFLPQQRDTVPLDSYDVFVYLSRYPIYEYVYNGETQRNEPEQLAGITAGPPDGTYETRKKHKNFRAGMTVMDTGSFDSYSTIAHEMIHAIGIPNHDIESNMDGGVCCGKLMKKNADDCPRCLDWSDYTKKMVQFIFSSADRCLFMNKPRSLYPPGPRRVLTADEQCQCYGYVSAQNTQEMQEPQMCGPSMYFSFFGYCSEYLQCVGEDREVHSTLIPLDGTPCEEQNFPNKVCYNRACQTIGRKI